ncbi:MAG: UpxY family transcription antiterminator [Deltaproteobacteria bacterium]|nr:UpxY family transcription antiterminator [Deltaproteobacteria bacterium]
MSWYALHTRSRHEDKVCLGLIQRSIEPFLPKIEVWSRRRDRRKRIEIPMFSGYIFINVADLTNDIKLSILKTPGVVKILGKPNSHVPIPVPDIEIQAIQRIIESKVEIQPHLYPKVGERTRIVDGPFKEIEGVVVATDYKKNLFVVSIELLRRSVAIKLEGFQVERL